MDFRIQDLAMGLQEVNRYRSEVQKCTREFLSVQSEELLESLISATKYMNGVLDVIQDGEGGTLQTYAKSS